MDQAQRELTAEGLGVAIVGVNDVGFEAGNAEMCEGRDLPWLQNTEEVDAWETWEVEYRDVVILGADGRRRHTFNVTEHDLATPSVYQAFKATLRDAAL